MGEITSSIDSEEDRKSEEFRKLRLVMGYCWSVAVVASPEGGKKMMERWISSKDRDIRSIILENLKKKRLSNMDGGWVSEIKSR